MDEFTTEELKLIRKALLTLASVASRNYTLSEQAEELADRFGLVIEERGSE
jgi:hypothetical protein